MDKKQKNDNKSNNQDDVVSQATKKAEVQELQEELARISVEHEEIKSQLKRAVADYQNLEKRVAEGRSELSSWATGELIRKILPVLDHLEKALKGANEEERQSGWFRGVELSVAQLKGILKEEGLEEIEATGEFNPSLHEAVDTKEPSDAEAMEGKGDNSILEIAEKGYTLGGKVIKPARVVVGRQQN